MKRIALFFFLSLVPIVCITARTTIMECVVPDNKPGEDPDNNGKPDKHKAPIRNLSCSCQDNLLIITSPYIIEEAEIIIYDEDNYAISSFTTNLSNSNNYFVLSQYVIENKYCIEIIYGNNKLIKNIE